MTLTSATLIPWRSKRAEWTPPLCEGPSGCSAKFSDIEPFFAIYIRVRQIELVDRKKNKDAAEAVGPCYKQRRAGSKRCCGCLQFSCSEFARQRPRSEGSKEQDRIERLEATLQQKDEVIAEIMAEHYNTVRLHSAIGYLTPADETFRQGQGHLCRS